MPLRRRRADVPELFAHFIDEALAQTGRQAFEMREEVRRQLVDGDWPGNARELKNFAIACVLGLESPARVQEDTPGLTDRVRCFEAISIREALERHGGEIGAVLDALQIPRKTLYDKMARHGIVPSDFRPK